MYTLEDSTCPRPIFNGACFIIPAVCASIFNKIRIDLYEKPTTGYREVTEDGNIKV